VKIQVSLAVLLTLIVSLVYPVTVSAGPLAQDITPEARAAALVKVMSPEEKVGQLFLVTFKGADVSDKSQIYDLITKQHIGGVVLTAANDNFVIGGQTFLTVYQMNAGLQSAAYQASQLQITDSVTGKKIQQSYVPLTIGISQEGDGSPNDQIFNQLTALPNAMAVGATWKPALATEVGNVMGSELQALGFNLLMGPSLDVLQMWAPAGFNDLGTRTFGGDPYWVGEMGKAYIQGVHEGSKGQIAVIAKHFPGQGSSDRMPEEEVATVRKVFDQLKQIDLAPFFAVTGDAPDTAAMTDGLLVSHIRYQGFQGGNIRDTTSPISFDPKALAQIMALPQFATWRDKSGLLVSDDLGSRAVRRFEDPTEKTFDARQVARKAFLAGNDLLYVDNFVASGDPDTYTSILHTLDLFAQKYREDPTFAQRVDESVTRILIMKLHLYKNFDLRLVIPANSGLSNIGKSQQVAFDVAKQAVTLISPSIADLDTALPKPPELLDHIVFLTDVSVAKQCSTCPDQTLLDVNALQNAVVRLYGPQVGGQIQQQRLTSYSSTDILSFLANEGPTGMESDLRSADWVVLAIQNPLQGSPDSQAMRRLLSERRDLLQNKKVIVFAFNAPYFLDATDISKLTAYYGLYSKGSSFVDVAARVLFQELTPAGALPVSVPGVGYDLIIATSPDPNQVIPLFFDLPATQKTTPLPANTPTPTPKPTVLPRLKLGDTITLKAGVIYDHNHHPVPDGTVVHFTFTLGGDNGSVQTVETTSSQGMAETAFRLEKSGQMDIRVTSDPALNSTILRIDIPNGTAVLITPVPPTPTVTASSTATITPTVTASPTATSTQVPPYSPGMGGWSLAMVVIVVGGGLAYGLGYWLWGTTRWGIRWGLCVVLGGLAGYTYLVVGLPGGKVWVEEARLLALVLGTLVGVGLGGLAAVLWRQAERLMRKPVRSKP